GTKRGSNPFGNSFSEKRKKPACILNETRKDRLSNALGQRACGFTFIRCERRDIDQGLYTRICAGFCNDRSAPRMSDENHIAIGTVNRSFGRRHIVCKGRGGILYRNYFVPLIHQRIDYLAPGRTVRPKPVDKNNRRFCFHGSPSLRKCV